MRMRTILGLALIAVLGMAFASQTAQDYFQQALSKERGEGNLKEAIALYQKAIDTAKDEALAAKAQLQIGLCYEKLGLTEARKAFQTVIEKYPAQADIVKQAREKLKGYAEVFQGALILRQANIPEGPISPDGQWIVQGADESGEQISLYEIATKKRTRLINDQSCKSCMVMQVEWAPSSEHLAYIFINSQNARELKLIDRNGMNKRTLSSEPNVKGLNIVGWTPDEKAVFVIFSRGSESPALGKITVAGGTLVKLKNIETLTFEGRLSPDGRFIAYQFLRSVKTVDYDIRILDIASGAEWDVVKHPAWDRLLGWVPDGSGILFSSNRAGSEGIWHLKLKDGKSAENPKLVQAFSGTIRAIGFGQNGAFYFVQSQMENDVYVSSIDIDSGLTLQKPELVEPVHQGSTRTPFWSRDGMILGYFFNSTPGLKTLNYNMLHLFSRETGKTAEMLLNLLPANYATPTFSQNGQFVFLTGTDRSADKRGLYCYRTDNGIRTPAYEINNEYSGPSLFAWSSEGNNLIFKQMDAAGKMSDRKDWIIQKTLPTGFEKELFRTEPGTRINAISLSPDEKKIAFVLGHSNEDPPLYELYSMPLAEGDAVKLLQLKETDLFPPSVFWTPSGKSLLFTKRHFISDDEQEKPAELWRIPDISNAQPKKMELQMYGLRDLVFHPDGKTIAFTSGKFPDQKIWVLENFLPKK